MSGSGGYTRLKEEAAATDSWQGSAINCGLWQCRALSIGFQDAGQWTVPPLESQGGGPRHSMAPPGSPRASPAEGVVTVSTLTRRVDDLADQLAATLHSVAERSAATVQCLQLLDVAGQGLEVRRLLCWSQGLVNGLQLIIECRQTQALPPTAPHPCPPACTQPTPRLPAGVGARGSGAPRRAACVCAPPGPGAARPGPAGGARQGGGRSGAPPGGAGRRRDCWRRASVTGCLHQSCKADAARGRSQGQ